MSKEIKEVTFYSGLDLISARWVNRIEVSQGLYQDFSIRESYNIDSNWNIIPKSEADPVDQDLIDFVASINSIKSVSDDEV